MIRTGSTMATRRSAVSSILPQPAVHAGNVGAVPIPIPAAVWLFGYGLVGLIGYARKSEKSNTHHCYAANATEP